MHLIDIMNERGIRIPKIQREYAQGRADEKSTQIRKAFVKKLLDTVLAEEETTLSLDFIYGMKSEYGLMLLDGQQRLTTLLLLAWFCGQNMGKWHFDYESRRAAQFFIGGLCNNPRREPDSEPGKEISQASWFFPAWKKDPTVAGMLTMLNEMWSQSPVLTGKCAKLGRIVFELEDELCGGDRAEESYGRIFLKMNARGLPLNDWENLKAVLDKFADQNQEEWKTKINNDWPESLWKIADDKKEFQQQINAVNIALEKIVLMAFQATGESYKISLADVDDKMSETEYKKKFFDLCSRYFSKLKDIQSSWPKIRSGNALWVQESRNSESKEFKDWLFTEKIPTLSEQLRFAFLTEAQRVNTSKRKQRILLNLLDNTTSISENDFAQMLQTGKEYLTGQKGLGELTPFNQEQLEDERFKSELDEDKIIELEKDPLVWYGSLTFLHCGERRNTIQTLRERLERLRAAAGNNWLSLFCTILQYIKYSNEDKDPDARRKLPDAVRIPFRIPFQGAPESVWAEEIFANSKVRLCQGVTAFLDGKTFNADAEAWLRHFKEIAETENIDPGLNYLAYTHGWNYCFTGNRLSGRAIRLAWSREEKTNLECIGKSYLRWDDIPAHGFIPDSKDGNIFYQVGDINDASWYTSDSPHRYRKSGEDENKNPVFECIDAPEESMP